MALEISDNENLFEPANYRVRLFLSVDLSGSTAFKNSSSGEALVEGATPKWVTIFEQFYTNFPARFASVYRQYSNDQIGSDTCPALWKAVGDELIFCGTVSNKKAVSVALMAFIATLHTYRKTLQGDQVDLNLKGAGWLAAFPEPNRAVQLRREGKAPELISASEALEDAADKRPYDYDFLGKAIDTGFRVAASATPERLVLSVQLARLLTSTQPGFGFDHDIRFDEPRPLKGVNGNEPYPMLYIDTMQHLPTEDLRQKERTLLKQGYVPSRKDLETYLEAYCVVVGTDEISLADSADTKPPDAPKSYLIHKEKIAVHLQQEKDREPNGSNGDEPDGIIGIDEIIVEETLIPLAGEETE